MPTEGWEGDIGNHDWGGFVSAQSPDPASGLLSQEASIRAAADRALSLRIDLGLSGSAVEGLAFLSVQNVFTEVNKIPGIRVGTVAVGSDYIMSDTDFEVLVDANAGDVLITLPAATGTGQYYRVKKIDDTANIVTVQADGTDVIDDSNLLALTDQWSDCTLIDAATGYWDNVGSGAAGDVASVTSSEVADLVQIASAAATSADNHANTVSARVVSVSAELASLIQIVSANVVSVEAHVNLVSAAAAFGDTHADVVSARVVSVSAELNSLLNSVESRLSTRIDTASGTGGGGSITSQEVSVLVQTASAAATSADAHANTVSARLVSASAELVSLVQIASAAATSADGHANTASAAATSADNHANTVSARVVSVSAELNSLLASVESRLSTRIDTVSGGTGGGGWDFVNAGNTDVDVANTNYQTVVTQTTSIAVNDTIIVDIWGTLLNNSGGTRTYSHQLNIGAVACIDYTEGGTTGAASATNRAIYWLRFVISISATNVWRALQTVVQHQTVTAVNTPQNTYNAMQVWNSGADNLTGSQAISYKVKSSNGTTTQTFTLHSYAIRRVAKNPP